MDRTIIISDRLSKAEKDFAIESRGLDLSVKEANEYAERHGIRKTTLERLIRTAMRMRPDVLIIDTDNEDLLNIPKAFDIPTMSLEEWRNIRLIEAIRKEFDNAEADEIIADIICGRTADSAIQNSFMD